MTAPDIAAAGLTCPLCDYDLRGLTEPRCPECGFAFTWAELADDQRNAHRYLFEHARQHRLRAFWRTYWRTCRPRRFWREVTPANGVNVSRLVVYWLLANSLLLAGTAVVAATDWGRLAAQIASERTLWIADPAQPGMFSHRTYPGFQLSAATLDQRLPRPGSPAFFRRLGQMSWGDLQPQPFQTAAVVLVWPWLSLVSLLLFQASMRRAKVNVRHVLRAVVYGCDFWLLMVAVAVTIMLLNANWTDLRLWFNDAPIHGTVPICLVVLGCATAATHRLGVAYARYLRFDRPLLTVAASQVIAVLVVSVVLVATGQLF